MATAALMATPYESVHMEQVNTEDVYNKLKKKRNIPVIPTLDVVRCLNDVMLQRSLELKLTLIAVVYVTVEYWQKTKKDMKNIVKKIFLKTETVLS